MPFRHNGRVARLRLRLMVVLTITVGLGLGVGSGVASAATFTVTNTSDSGAGSLRQAIIDANANPGFDQIFFNIGGGGPQTIVLSSGNLPVSASVNINAKTQPGYAGTPLITIDCNGQFEAFFLAGHDVTTIQGFIIHGFSQNAITVWQTSNGNWLLDNWLGINSAGADATSAAFARGVGIQSSYNVLQRNVISGVDNGITLGGDPVAGPTINTQGNYIANNIIGLNPAGTAAVPNSSDGVFLGAGAHSNFIGPNNTISGNASAGVELLHNTNQWNVVFANRIGLNHAGTGVIGNGAEGILLTNGAHNNAIGGGFGGNYISGNFTGIIAGDIVPNFFSAWGNWIQNNWIGVDVNGNPAGNTRVGVHIVGNGSYWNTVAENVIANNGWWGVYVQGAPTNWIENNFIGQNAGGTPMGNGYDGIFIDGAGWNTVVYNTVAYNGFQPGFNWASIRQANGAHTTGYWMNVTRDDERIVSIVNYYRSIGQDCPGEAKDPVPPLTLNSSLHDAAQGHAEDMATWNFVGHASSNGNTFVQRLAAVGYDTWVAAAENVAGGQWTPDAVVNQWLASLGHCRNIMSPAYTELGVGHQISSITGYTHFWVQNFGRR